MWYHQSVDARAGKRRVPYRKPPFSSSENGGLYLRTQLYLLRNYRFGISTDFSLLPFKCSEK